MAWPGTPSTTAGALGSAVTSLFQRAMLEAMFPMFRFYTYAEKTNLPTNAGQAVVWNREVALGPGYKATEGYPISAVKTLSTQQVSALIETITDAVTLSERAFLTSTPDMDAYASRMMAKAAADTIERFIIQALVADSTVAHYVKKAGSVINSNSVAVSAGASATALAMSDIRIAETRLEVNNAPTYDNTGYLGIIHPTPKADVVGDSKFETWNVYTTPEKMYANEIGRAYNVRFVQSTLVPISVGSSDGNALSSDKYQAVVVATSIFGAGAFGVTELDGGLKSYVINGEQKSDPTNLTRVYGYKANLAAKVINPSALVFIWSDFGSQLSAVSSVSARRLAGLTCDTNQVAAW